MTTRGYPPGVKAGITVVRTFDGWTGGSGGSNSFALGPTRPGSALLVAMGGDSGAGYHLGDATMAAAGLSHARLFGTAVNTSYRGADLYWAGPEETARVYGASGTTIQGSASTGAGNTFAELMGIEIMPGSFKGELLEARSTWTTSSSVSYTPFAKAYKDKNLYLVVIGGLHAGGAGLSGYPTANPAGPRLAAGGTLTGISLIKYIPGTRPVVSWSYGRAASNTISTGLMR